MAIRITREQLRRIIREAAFDDEGTPTGTGMGNVARTSETRLVNTVSDALGEDEKFISALERMTEAAYMAIVRSDLIDGSVVEELTAQDFTDTFGADVEQAATQSIVSMIKSIRSTRNR